MSAILEKYKNGLQLRADVLVAVEGENVTFYKKRALTIKTGSDSERAFLKSLKNGMGFAALSVAINEPRLGQILGLLEHVGYLKPYVNERELNGLLGRQLDWLSHFSNEPRDLQREISQKKVLIIGCGGTGGIIAEHLVRAGVRYFVLLDGAQVDLPDMNRQLTYVIADCTKFKTEVLGERIKQINPKSEVHTYTQFLCATEELETFININRPDLVISAADTPAGLIHNWIATACANTGTAVLFGGVGLKEGTLGPLLTNPEACRKYAADALKTHQKIRGTDNIPKASICFTNSLIAVWLAFEAFKFLTKITQPLSADGAMAIDLFDVTGKLLWKHSV